MPILIDYSQFILSSIFRSMEEGLSNKDVVQSDTVRHIFLSMIRSNRQKFKNEYGELVICCDSKDTWRKDIYPYYKARRNKSKKESDLDWGKLYESIEELRLELVEFMPYKVLQIPKTEADDIIGTICHTYGTDLISDHDRFLILSRDKDFKQLQVYANVKQYDQRDKKYILVEDPEQYLKEMIIKGDSNDDVPNILSPDNVFVSGKRQSPMTAKRLEKLLEGNLDADTQLRYDRNKLMVDLGMVPIDLQKQIIDQYENYTVNGRSKMHKYFISKGLKYLLEDIGDF